MVAMSPAIATSHNDWMAPLFTKAVSIPVTEVNSVSGLQSSSPACVVSQVGNCVICAAGLDGRLV